MLRQLMLVIAAGMLGSMTAPVWAQGDRGVENVNQCERDSKRIGGVQLQLVEAALKLGLQGAHFSYAPIIGCLKENESRLLDRVELKADTSYVVVAVCERDKCQDIDLIVFDETNRAIAADLDDGAEPWVAVTPRWDGEYFIKILLQNCSETTRPSCSFAAGVFVRDKR